jgi:hypothetical protein
MFLASCNQIFINCNIQEEKSCSWIMKEYRLILGLKFVTKSNELKLGGWPLGGIQGIRYDRMKSQFKALVYVKKDSCSLFQESR